MIGIGSNLLRNLQRIVSSSSKVMMMTVIIVINTRRAAAHPRIVAVGIHLGRLSLVRVQIPVPVCDGMMIGGRDIITAEVL